MEFPITADVFHVLLHLSCRGYTGKKLDDNMECEIMQVLVEEANESYDEDIVTTLQSSVPTDMESNVQRLVSWVAEWKEAQTEE